MYVSRAVGVTGRRRPNANKVQVVRCDPTKCDVVVCNEVTCQKQHGYPISNATKLTICVDACFSNTMCFLMLASLTERENLYTDRMFSFLLD